MEQRPFTEQASVHPQTITAFSEGKIAYPSRRKMRYPKKAFAEYAFQVHPEVWNIALELSDYEPWRIEILSETEVMVHNNDWRHQ